MIPYAAPLADLRFLLTRLIGLERLAALPSYEGVNEELVDAVLGEAAKLAEDIFAPLNQVGDKEGVHLTAKGVTMPAGFHDAYQAHVAGGWNSVPVETEWGGQGLPWCLALPVQEMWQSANLALALCTLLNQGAIELLAAHGSEALKALYLPKLVSGAWTGTMNISEPQAGSDVGTVRCKAVPEGDHYRITGQKIFISYGDHDLTDNIIHFVLARIEGAPEGTRGLSLFLVPKIRVNADGSLGEPNDIHVVAVEHKLGQHASPTCALSYGDQGGAIGYLVGAEHGGINAMFVMMNHARICVGVQGLALMERAWQQARDYARTRLQSRDVGKPNEPPVAIIQHPDVRRMLMMMRSQTEAARALALMAAYALDSGKRAPDATQRKAAQARVDLLTPVVKAWLTDLSNEVTSLAIQVLGGMGYIEEAGVAQYMRDARVLAIYEGTNGIQANDLVFRKLARDGGAAFQVLLGEMEAFLVSSAPQDSSSPSREGAWDPTVLRHLSSSLTHLRATSAWLLEQAKANPARAAASAAPFLRLLGNTLGGFYLLQSAALAQRDLDANIGDPAFLRNKIATAAFYATHILPQNAGLAVTVTEGAEATLGMPVDGF